MTSLHDCPCSLLTFWSEEGRETFSSEGEEERGEFSAEYLYSAGVEGLGRERMCGIIVAREWRKGL